MRKEDLAPVSGRADTGGAMYVDTHIATPATKGLARVEAHAHLKRCAVRPAMLHQGLLGGHRRPQGIPGPGERHQEGVPLCVYLLSAPFRERITEYPTVLVKTPYVKVAMSRSETSTGWPLKAFLLFSLDATHVENRITQNRAPESRDGAEPFGALPRRTADGPDGWR